MNIRKQITILCLVCCHALGVMAEGQLVRNYVPISRQDAEKLFNFHDPRIRVTGVSYGDYEIVGSGSDKQLFASSNTSTSHSFALKVVCADPWCFAFYIQEVKLAQKEISYIPTYKHTVLVDGQASVLPKTERHVWDEREECELSAGEHEIVIMSNFIGPSSSPRSVQFKGLFLHAHNILTVAQRPASCGQDGFIRKKCKSCSYHKESTLPMPAAEHEFGSEHTLQNSCMVPPSVVRKCSHCGTSEFKIKKHESRAHNFQNGRCVNEGCEVKLPVQNAAGIYQVGDACELRGLAEQIAAGYIPRDCNIDLTSDIIYPANLAHIPIGTTDYPFAGTFDGHGHRIAGMQPAIPSDMTGLFGMVEGTPRRLAVIANVIIDSSSNMQGINMTGAVAGRADYCDIMRCVSRAAIQGVSNVGGIVGYSERECHLIDCARLGNIDSKENGGMLSGTLRQGYIMDSYGSGSLANGVAEPAIAPTADSPLRHCFLLDAKAPMAGVTSFTSDQLSDGTLARKLCEKNGTDTPAHWQQAAADGCPMPVFVALTDRPASAIQPPSTRAAIPDTIIYNPTVEDGDEEEYVEDDEEWYSFNPESDLLGDFNIEDFVFYDEADSTLNDFTCYVTTTYRNVPAQPMFTAMEGGDATECDVTYCKNDSTVIMEYNYTMDGMRYLLTNATKQYMTPDSLVHLEHYDTEGFELDDEFLLTSSMVFRPDDSGYEESVSYGVSTRVMDWEVSHAEGKEPTLNYYLYDENGQECVEVYSIPLTDTEYEGEDFLLPADMDYTLDEYDRLIDLHYIRTDSITGEKYNIGGEYYIYDEEGELSQIVSYEPVKPGSQEMRQTEYCTIHTYNAEDVPTSIDPVKRLQPGTLDGSPARTSTNVYDLRGNLVRHTNDASTLKTLPKGIYITRGRKIMVY